MKRIILNAAAAALFLCTGALTATAQTAYGLAYSMWWTEDGSDYTNGLQTASVDFSTLSSTGAAATLMLDETHFVNYDVQTATSAGNKYYAVLEYYDEDGTENTTVDLYSINFTTQELTKVTTTCYGNDAGIRNAGYTMSSLAYVDATSTLYGIEYTYDDEAAANVTNLYKVSTDDGSLTKVASYSDQYLGLVAKDGKLYIAKPGSGWWNVGLSLYEVTDGVIADEPVFTVSSVTGLSSTSTASFAATDGKIYMQVSTSIYALDLDAQTATKVGSTDKALKGLTFTKSSEGPSAGEEEEEETTRFLVRTTRYGDSMGYVSSDQDMSKTEYFYDIDYKLRCVVESGRGYTEAQTAGDYSVTYYTKYLYNENGLLDSTARYQTGLYDFGDMAYKLRSTTTGYEYDEQGRLIVEPTSSYTYEYTYDEKNNIVKSIKKSLAGSTIQQIEYSDFVGKNKPQTIVSTCPDHPTWTSYIYNATRTYDSNKNILTEVRSRDGQNYYKETYTYDGKFLTEKLESYISGDEETPNLKTTYKMVDDNPDKIWYSDSTYYAGKWTGNGTPHVDEYVDFAEMGELVAIRDLTATLSDEGINNVVLKFATPYVALTSNCNFNIYRRGELIATKGLSELLTDESDENGMPILAYTDSALYNNDYEYFVQPTLSEFSEDLWDDPEATGDPVGYNISNLAEIKVALDLPAVTDLKQGEPYLDEDQLTNVAISWTNPEYPEEYGFISNNLMFVNASLADDTTEDPEVNSLTGLFYGNNNVFILTRYKYGKAISDTLTVNPTVNGINTVSADGKLSLDGRNLTIDGNASVAIYGMSGKMEASVANANSMSLDALKPGAYIVCITKEGKTQAYKVILK